MEETKTSLGIEENLEALIAYLGLWITGLIILLLEKKSEYVRFHAMQSLVTFLTLTILDIIFGILSWVVPIIFSFLSTLTGIAILIAWIVGMIKAYQGEKFKFPLFGDIAENFLKNANF